MDKDEPIMTNFYVYYCTSINTEENGLAGTLPAEIGHLSKLENLVIKNEEGIVGTIPATIAKISTLNQLALYNNKLTGQIPQQLFTMSSLRYVNFESNVLTGFLSAVFQPRVFHP